MKGAIKYRLSNLARHSGLFLALMIALLVITAIIQFNSYNTFTDSGITFYMVAVSAFVCGTLSFAKEFAFLSQNGITRSQIHWSFVSVLPVAVIYAIAERLLHIFNCFLNGGKYHSFLGALFYIEKRNVLLDILIEIVSFVMFLSVGYFISAFFHRIKITYCIIAIVVVAFGMFAEITVAQMPNHSGYPLFVLALQDFFGGSLQGELLMSHLIASQILVSLIALSLSHIFTLSYTVNRKGNAK